jgi:hypothetical protein
MPCKCSRGNGGEPRARPGTARCSSITAFPLMEFEPLRCTLEGPEVAALVCGGEVALDSPVSVILFLVRSVAL